VVNLISCPRRNDISSGIIRRTIRLFSMYPEKITATRRVGGGDPHLTELAPSLGSEHPRPGDYPHLVARMTLESMSVADRHLADHGGASRDSWSTAYILTGIRVEKPVKTMQIYVRSGVKPGIANRPRSDKNQCTLSKSDPSGSKERLLLEGNVFSVLSVYSFEDVPPGILKLNETRLYDFPTLGAAVSEKRSTLGAAAPEGWSIEVHYTLAEPSREIDQMRFDIDVVKTKNRRGFLARFRRRLFDLVSIF